MNSIPCELDITSSIFHDATIITYKIELLPSGNKIDFNVLDYDDFTIRYMLDTISNSPAGHQTPTQYKKNFWIITINGGKTITTKVALF